MVVTVWYITVTGDGGDSVWYITVAGDGGDSVW